MKYRIQNKKCYHKEDGFVVLMSIIVVGAVGLAIVVSIISSGIASSKTALMLEKSYQAQALSTACSEEALRKIKDSIPYTGSGTLYMGQGYCTYTVTKQTGQNRTIISTGYVGSVIRKMKIIINKIRPSINIVSWIEVADF